MLRSKQVFSSVTGQGVLGDSIETGTIFSGSLKSSSRFQHVNGEVVLNYHMEKQYNSVLISECRLLSVRFRDIYVLDWTDSERQVAF
jgi:hypothetical protein